jgi:hypothetical protein
VSNAPTNSAETLAQLRRVTPVCERVAKVWRQGGTPRIEDELSAVSEPDRPTLLAELLLMEWTYRRERGEAVEVMTYQQRFASSAGVVRSAWQRWQEGVTIDAMRSATASTHSPASPLTHLRRNSIAVELPHLPEGYTNLERLGEGGMGVVYRADDPRLGRKVALKRLNRLTPEGLERFRQEAMALARLQHPNVVQVFHLDDLAGEPVIVMEYVAGGSLEQLLLNGPLGVERSAALVATLARAVGAAHAAGVVHRDLKPGNVLLSAACGFAGNNSDFTAKPQAAESVPKIADFGVAHILDDATDPALSGTLSGTPSYMAPEQALGLVSEVGPATDVWALGVILYRCLTGRLPFVGESMLDTLEKVKLSPPEPFRESEGVPADLAEVCLACLRKRLRQRPGIEELVRRLERFTAPPNRLPEAERGSHKPDAQARGHRGGFRRVLAAVGLLVLAGLAFAGLSLLGRPRHAGGEKNALSPPRIAKFSVVHRQVVVKDGKKTTRNLGEIGKDSFQPRFGDAVQIEVELVEAGYLYLLALSPNGQEHLLWPEDMRQTPPKVQELSWPPRRDSGEEGGYSLNDEPRGGVYALAVVAASAPLPAYEEWRIQRKRKEWEKLPAGKGVWLADETGVRNLEASSDEARGMVQPLPGTGATELERRLRRVVQELRQGGAETVVVRAFPVRAKERP